MNIEHTDEQWTEIIRPKSSLFDIKLKELWSYRDLVLLFVKRDFVKDYKQTILGPLWFFIQPLIQTLTFFFIFSKVAKIGTGKLPPILFYLSGITIWTYFADCFNKTSTIFISNAAVFGKVYFPRLVTPISIVISSMVKFGIQLLLFILIYTYYLVFEKVDIHLNFTILLFPFYVLIMATLGLGLGIIFSSLTTKYKDLVFLLQFGIQLLMYATPVIYPLANLSPKYKSYLLMNPITPIVEAIRYGLFGDGIFDIWYLAYSLLFSIIILIVGVLLFNKVEKSFMDTI